jgi:hypothetical protein
MKKEEMTQQDALLLEAAKNIQQHLNDFSNVRELWETCAKAGAAIAFCQSKVSNGELDDVTDMLNQYICILDLLKPFEDGSK